MIRIAVRALTLLFLGQFAACSNTDLNLSQDTTSVRDTGADYANAIMAGMERARAMRAIRLRPSTAGWSD
ncbi:MAG: hypothetical protein JWP20_12 [Roseomonas sp.]|nr:hypothetical protein [Roseomonas sp.]